MEALIISGKEIHSLDELRENFDIRQVMELFSSNRLAQWLEECFYEEQAQEVVGLFELQPDDIELKLCEILGMDPVEAPALTPEQQAEYDRKAEFILRHTDDPAVLQHVFDTATNQIELAELIRSGKKVIYLCAASFHVPLSRGGIHYIGIANPRIEIAGTEEQYHQAGIAFENIAFPNSGNASFNEHEDDIKRSGLALAVHALANHKLSWAVSIPWKMKVADENYSMRYLAEQSARQELDGAYGKAKDFFTPDKSTCLAGQLAEKYVAYLKSCCGCFMDELAPLCIGRESRTELFKNFKAMLDNARAALYERFAHELKSNSVFYTVPPKSHYANRLEIVYNNSTSSGADDLSDFIIKFFGNMAPYSAPNLFEIVRDLENDVNARAAMFFTEAHKVFCEYCDEIGSVAEELAKVLTAEELCRLTASITSVLEHSTVTSNSCDYRRDVQLWRLAKEVIEYAEEH